MSLFNLGAHARDRGGEPALVVGERTVSFAELDARASSLAGMVADAPLVSFVARPSDALLTLALACISLGVPILPIHPRLTKAEIDAALARFPEARFVDEREIEVALATPPRRAPRPLQDDERTLAVLLSSGTTGDPKAVRLSRRAFAASARASAENLRFTASDRWLLSMPFSHAGGLSILTRCLAAGRPVVVHEGFDPSRVVGSVERESVTLLSVVPTMLASLLEEDRQGRLRSLRAVLVGGAACPPDLHREARERGIAALTTYGLTEACSQVTTQLLARPELGTSLDSGIALSGVEVEVVDRDGRRVVGEQGRIRVGGATLMSGYVGEAPLAVGSIIETGDLGAIDERGRLFVSGRADDLIITGGENVAPLEVERALVTIAGVREALVVGLPDARWGRIVGALLVLDEGRSEQEVLAAANDRLVPHKRPRRVLAVATIPRGPTGKPDRRAARARFDDPEGA